MHQYLKPITIVKTFKDSKSYTDSLTEGFMEYERLGRNRPQGSIPKEYPKTTDGTTASIIRKTPHRIIQQLPTGKVRSVTNDWLSVVASFVYTEKIIPHANEGYALLQKCWNVVERFLEFGYCGTYTPFVNHNGYYCTDLRLIYWGDVFVQPGKLSDDDSQYVFMRSWWQTNDIEALIESQSKLDEKKRTWDVDALKRVKETTHAKDDQASTPVEKEKEINSKGGVEFITGFQRGKGAKFYTFHASSDEILRTKVNKDPRGELPISFAYGDIDGQSPFGRSIIDLVAGMQNLMDGEMQMYQYNRALQLNPPLIKRGNFSKNKIKFAPNVIIDVGSDPAATVEPLEIDTTALKNFPNNYGLMKSQLLNLLASPDTSISAEVGNPGFSKTPQGVEASKANLSIDDNYVRKQFETWFERWSETAVNLYFAERTGVEELQLDKDTAQELRTLAEKGKFDSSLLSDDDRIRIDYNTATEKLKFEIDASTSKMADEVRQLESLQGLNQLLDKSQVMQSIVPPQKQMELWNAIVKNSGVEDPEALVMNDEDKKAAIEKLSQPQDDIRDQIITNYKDAPEDIKRQIEQKNGFQPSQEMSPVQQNIDAKAATGTTEPPQLTPEHILKADDQAHKHELEKEKLDQDRESAELEKTKLTLEAIKVKQQGEKEPSSAR